MLNAKKFGVAGHTHSAKMLIVSALWLGTSVMVIPGCTAKGDAPEDAAERVTNAAQPEMKAGGWEALCHVPAPELDMPCNTVADCDPGGDCLSASCEQDLERWPSGQTVCKYDAEAHRELACKIAPNVALGTCQWDGNCCTEEIEIACMGGSGGGGSGGSGSGGSGGSTF
ncbi:MAG: hypothetical protein ACTHU0_21270 [Kofleriaceae bacterium]